MIPLLLGAALAAAPLLTIPTDRGELQLVSAYHGTLHLKLGELDIWVDPWSKAPMTEAAPAELVLITDVHFDHLDKDALAKVRADATTVVAPKAVADELPGVTVLALGATVSAHGVEITSVPMYNLTRGPEPGKLFHDKGRGTGFVLAVGGKRIYVAGDTECTPEMKALKGIDHAFLPMNLPYTMPPDEAAACAMAFRPGAVTPIHYAGSDLEVFAKGLDPAVKLVRVDAYPGGLPW